MIPVQLKIGGRPSHATNLPGRPFPRHLCNLTGEDAGPPNLNDAGNAPSPQTDAHKTVALQFSIEQE